MDETGHLWYFSDMTEELMSQERIPSWSLYGEERAFPDILHCERIIDRSEALDWIIQPHRHPHLHQFFLVLTDGIEVVADGQKLVPVAPCVLTIPRNAVHGFVFAAGSEGFVVTVPVQNLPDMYDPRSATYGALGTFAAIPSDETVMSLFEQIYAEHGAQADGRTNMLGALAAQLACHIMRLMPNQPDRARKNADPRFQEFEALAKERFRENWSLSDYANALSITPRHLGRICGQATGQSPSEYLEAITMQEACRLLVYTRNSIAAIGYILGFDDPSYFSRAFRRHLGSTPRDYRAAFEQE